MTDGRVTSTKKSSFAALAATVRESVNRFNRRMRAERPESELTLSQISALAVLDRKGALTPSELAACERVKPPSMTRIIAVLEAKGVAVRTPHPDDRRQVLVAVTESGKDLLRTNRRAREAWLARQLGELTAEQRELLSRAMRILDVLAGT